MRLILLLLPLFLSTQEWELTDGFLEEGLVTISVHGNISQGDKLMLTFTQDDDANCKNVSETFSLYSTETDVLVGIENLPSEYILAKFNGGEEYLIKPLYILEFGMGSITYFSSGTYEVEDIVESYKENEIIEIELVDFYDIEIQKKLDLDIKDYFDIPTNNWNTQGLEESLLEGRKQCLQLTSDS